MELNDLFHAAADSGASDILLVSGAPPMLRVDGDLCPTELDPLTPSVVEKLIFGHLTEAQARLLRESGDVDYSIGVPRLGRFRVNAHRTRPAHSERRRKTNLRSPN
jgi:twitching motility protein PilT